MRLGELLVLYSSTRSHLPLVAPGTMPVPTETAALAPDRLGLAINRIVKHKLIESNMSKGLAG